MLDVKLTWITGNLLISIYYAWLDSYPLLTYYEPICFQFYIVMHGTGKSLSEALIFASTNPQHDDRLFIVHENCKLRIPEEHVVYI